MDLKFTTKIRAKDINEKIINAERRVIGTGLAKEIDPWRHKKWLTAASWEISYFGSGKRKTRQKRIIRGNGKKS